jgi:HAD superfamily hydrolase (TIGR01490 family)
VASEEGLSAAGPPQGANAPSGGSAAARAASRGARRLALFDLDGTLLDGDTDELWCQFLIAEGILDRAGFEARNRSVAERYAEGAITPAEFCAFYASTLAGRTPAEWAGQRERFVATVIVPRLGAAARALVDGHRKAGDRLLLTTATNRFLTTPIAALLGFDEGHLIATELELEGGRFTGRNRGVLNMREGKVARLQAWFGEAGIAAGALADAVFYSDSGNDLPLLRVVGRPVAVDPDARLRAEAERAGWNIVSLLR